MDDVLFFVEDLCIFVQISMFIYCHHEHSMQMGMFGWLLFIQTVFLLMLD